MKVVLNLSTFLDPNDTESAKSQGLIIQEVYVNALGTDCDGSCSSESIRAITNTDVFSWDLNIRLLSTRWGFHRGILIEGGVRVRHNND